MVKTGVNQERTGYVRGSGTEDAGSSNGAKEPKSRRAERAGESCVRVRVRMCVFLLARLCLEGRLGAGLCGA